MKYQGKTIQKNKNSNTWYTRYRVNGKQYYISAKTQKECYNKLKKAIAESESQIAILPTLEKENQGITLIEWYNQWLELYKLNKMKPETIRGYNSLLKHIPQELKNKQLKAITLKDLLTTINNCKAERQKQNLYDLLNMLYKKAIDNDFIEKKPC